MHFVIGASGFLGRTFFEGPSRNDLIPITRSDLDLSKPDFSQLIERIKTHRPQSAFITAAMASPDDCLKSPELSHAVNVDGTIALIRVLKEFGVKPVFFSTDHVYDGQKGLYTELDPYCPVTLYGRQKVQTETFLRENLDDFLILRTSKQVAMRLDKKNVLSEMAGKLNLGKPIRCATDHWISPSFVEDIVAMSLVAANRNLKGIFHIADAAYSRLEIGQLLAATMGADPTLVHSCSINDFEFPEDRPPKCTMIGTLAQATDYNMTSLESGFTKLLKVL